MHLNPIERCSSLSKKIELFELLSQSIALIQKDTKWSYLEAFIENLENQLDGYTVAPNHLYQRETINQLNTVYQSISTKGFEDQAKKEAAELALVKGMREDHLQANHQLTPNSISLFLSYLIELMVEDKSHLHILDLALGTGNLLSTIYYFIEKDNREIHLYGIDNDELLIAVASSYFAFQNVAIELLHGDALDNLLIEPMDLIIGDLPVGYYPIDEKAQQFNASFAEGHSYTHFLLIEQALNYLKEGGFGFFLVPSNTFEIDSGKILLKTIQEKGHLQGLVHLPKELFQQEKARKSILMIQKQGEEVQQASEVLLAQAPMFDDQEKFEEFLGQISQWKVNNLTNKGSL